MDLPASDANHPYLDAVNANRGILRIGPAIIREYDGFPVCGVDNVIQHILQQWGCHYAGHGQDECRN